MLKLDKCIVVNMSSYIIRTHIRDIQYIIYHRERKKVSRCIVEPQCPVSSSFSSPTSRPLSSLLVDAGSVELIHPEPLYFPLAEERFLHVHFEVLQSAWQLHLIIRKTFSGAGGKSVITVSNRPSEDFHPLFIRIFRALPFPIWKYTRSIHRHMVFCYSRCGRKPLWLDIVTFVATITQKSLESNQVTHCYFRSSPNLL